LRRRCQRVADFGWSQVPLAPTPVRVRTSRRGQPRIAPNWPLASSRLSLAAINGALPRMPYRSIRLRRRPCGESARGV
jgi:hypothetical protein